MPICRKKKAVERVGGRAGDALLLVSCVFVKESNIISFIKFKVKVLE